MTLLEYLDNKLRTTIEDEHTKIETLRKLYGQQKLFTLEYISNAWKAGRDDVINTIRT